MASKLLLLATRTLSSLTLVACLGVGPHHPGTGQHANLPLRTLGGMQFWADVAWRGDWRIQRNVFFGQHRLLDPGNVRRAWGGREACQAALDERVAAQPIEHLVVLLHGLGRSRHSMEPLAEAFEAAGLDTVCLAYPSTRVGLEQHARDLNDLLDGLEDVRRVSFVTHSMGGLVVRAALGRAATWRGRIELGRVVQLGPPNRGSQLARWVRPTPIGWLLGPCLATVASGAARGLPLLPCDAAVIAGGRSDGEGWNPLVAGDDDGVVGVAETHLDGVDEHLVVRDLHTVLMQNEEVQAAAVRFVHGDTEAEQFPPPTQHRFGRGGEAAAPPRSGGPNRCCVGGGNCSASVSLTPRPPGAGCAATPPGPGRRALAPVAPRWRRPAGSG